MSQNKDIIQSHLEDFERELTRSLSIAKDPEAIRWALFSVGSKDIEEIVLDKLVNEFLTNIEGVYLFRVDKDPSKVIAVLKEAIEHIESSHMQKKVASSSESFGFELITGVDSDE